MKQPKQTPETIRKFHDLAIYVTQQEGKKEQVNIAQVSEILKTIRDLLEGANQNDRYRILRILAGEVILSPARVLNSPVGVNIIEEVVNHIMGRPAESLSVPSRTSNIHYFTHDIFRYGFGPKDEQVNGSSIPKYRSALINLIAECFTALDEVTPKDGKQWRS